MPKQKSFIIKIKGFLKGVSYYFEKGEPRERVPNPPTKDQIYNDPRFASVRANNKEFGGASTFSKAICVGLQNNVKTFKDGRFTSRLTGVLRKIIQKGSGSLGRREANLFNDPEALIGHQLHKNYVFNRIFTIKPTISINPDRTNITLEIPKIAPENLKKYPKSTTHFILTAAISTVSLHNWDSKVEKYIPKHPTANALGKTVHSEPLLCKIEHPSINLVLLNPIKYDSQFTFHDLPNVAITVWLGVTFGKMVKDGFTSFQTAKAMECIAVL